jgi:hypothetical protein
MAAAGSGRLQMSCLLSAVELSSFSPAYRREHAALISCSIIIIIIIIVFVVIIIIIIHFVLRQVHSLLLRSGASSVNFQYPPISLNSYNSCLRLIPRLPVTPYCYVAFLLLCLFILIDKHALFCILFANWHYPPTLTEGFPCFSLSCKANASVQLAKTGHSPHSS